MPDGGIVGRLVDLQINSQHFPSRDIVIIRQRERAVGDILKTNQFCVHNFSGDQQLHLGTHQGRLLWTVKAGEQDWHHAMSTSSLRKVIKDYKLICDSYHDAVKGARAQQIEAIDMGRRGVHNEGAELLLNKLDGKIQMDFETARKLFTVLTTL